MSKLAEYQRETAYRFYVTNTMYYYGRGQCIGYKFEDVLRPRAVDTRTGDEIALDVISRLDLRFREE